MLDANLQNQLKAYLEKVTRPILIDASVGDDAKSHEMLDLLNQLSSLSDRITLNVWRDDAERRPSFGLTSPGQDISLRFAGIPMGHEFTSLVLALLQVGGHPSKVAPAVLEQVRNLEGEYKFETYFSLSCQNCPDVVQALNLAAVLNPASNTRRSTARCSRKRSRRARSCRCRPSTSMASCSTRAA